MSRSLNSKQNKPEQQTKKRLGKSNTNFGQTTPALTAVWWECEMNKKCLLLTVCPEKFVSSLLASVDFKTNFHGVSRGQSEGFGVC